MVRIYLTGDMCVSQDGRLITADRMPGRQGRRLFAYLALERSRPVARDELVDCLWPRRPPAAFDTALSAIISKLRTLLHEIGIDRQTLAAANGCYRLELPAGSWLDIEAANESVHMAEAALRANDPQAAYGPAVVACAILRRPFLPGEDAPWIDARRGHLRNSLLRALDCLASIHNLNGEPTLALRAAQDAVELEPFREEAHRRLMLIHEASGNRAEALRAYARLQALLETELGTRPSPETRSLFDALT
jgi:SARP family transcriptional regulator, regulator of embCAB operon